MLPLIRRTIRLLTPRYRRLVAYLGLGALVSAVIDAAAFGLLYPLIQLLTTSGTSSGKSTTLRVVGDVFGTTAKHHLEVRLGITIVALFVLSSIVGIILTYAQSRVVANSEADVASELFTLYVHAPYAQHLSQNSSELVRNVENAVGDVHQLVLLPLLIIGANVITLVIITTVVAIVNPLVTLIALVYFAATTYLYVRIVSPRARHAGRDYHRSRAVTLRMAREAFGGIKSLQAADALDPITDDYRAAKETFAQARHSMNYYSQLPQYYLQSALIGGVVLFTLVVLLSGRGDVTALIGLLMAASIRMMPALYTTLSSVNRIRNGQAALDEVSQDFDRLRTAAAETTPETPSAGPATALASANWHRIAFEDVTFSYPSSAEAALHDVSFTIARGDTIGLVGRSGAGKTTVVDLLLGLFTTDGGQILVDDVALTESTVKQWRRRVSYVPQDVFLLDGSINDNLRFSRSGEPVPPEPLWNALERAQLADFVNSLPDGADTIVGERGVRMSAGQRQRLGIARALYRDPEILILDEATSALDTTTEAAVTETVESLYGTLTIIMIAHRLSTVRYCDRLLLLERGRLVAQGDFDTLSRESPIFAEFARLSRISVTGA